MTAESAPTPPDRRPSPHRRPQKPAGQGKTITVPDGYFAVGQIVGAHGLRGELKVEPYTDFPDRFAPGAVLRLGPHLQQVTVVQMRPHKTHFLVQIAEAADRNAAEALRGAWFYLPEEDAAALEAGAYWVHDIVGLQVFTTAGLLLGEIVDVLTTGANDVYVVRPAAGVNRGQDVLLPAITDVILTVNLAKGIMTVRLLDGLIDM